MAKKLYVGNLAYSTTQEAVRELFAQAGDVADVVAGVFGGKCQSCHAGLIRYDVAARIGQGVDLSEDIIGVSDGVRVSLRQVRLSRGQYAIGGVVAETDM